MIVGKHHANQRDSVHGLSSWRLVACAGLKIGIDLMELFKPPPTQQLISSQVL